MNRNIILNPPKTNLPKKDPLDSGNHDERVIVEQVTNSYLLQKGKRWAYLVQGEERTYEGFARSRKGAERQARVALARDKSKRPEKRRNRKRALQAAIDEAQDRNVAIKLNAFLQEDNLFFQEIDAYRLFTYKAEPRSPRALGSRKRRPMRWYGVLLLEGNVVHEISGKRSRHFVIREAKKLIKEGAEKGELNHLREKLNQSRNT